MEKISTGNANNVKPQKLNTEMLILQCIGIVAVVMPIIAIAFFWVWRYTLSPHFKKSTVLARIGRGSKYVMYYHQLIFAFIVLCLYVAGILLN